jgi:ankyrin repeat protein
LYESTHQNSPIAYGQKEHVELLIDMVDDLNAREDDRDHSYPALYRAIEWGYIDIAKLLIAKGADVNAGGFLSRL